MEIEADDDLLRTAAAGGPIDYALWPALLPAIISRLDKIAHNDFPIPNLPPPPQPVNHPGEPRLLSPLPSSSLEPSSSQPSSQEANKENNPVEPPAAGSETAADEQPALAPGALPPQIEAQLVEITAVLSTFPTYPPHTIQRLAELVLQPRQHYRHLASYLHAVDRVVHVTSGSNTYPLPPAIPDMSSMTLSNGVVDGAGKDPASSVSWSNPTTTAPSTLGTDEALGGALLTPIPWLTRRPSPIPAPSHSGDRSPSGHAEVRTESTETIDGPNGMGSIETVSISVNGIPSMGASAARGVTQEDPNPEDEAETPHARGPEEIGVGDLGPQSATTSFIGGPGVEMQGIDVEAAVGRKADDTKEDEDEGDGGEGDIDDAASATSSKREAEDELDGLAAKKLREEDADEPMKEADAQDGDDEPTAEAAKSDGEN